MVASSFCSLTLIALEIEATEKKMLWCHSHSLGRVFGAFVKRRTKRTRHRQLLSR
jgi:hypothetical protein